MPLPGNSTLTLQGQSRPGDPLHSKPKQAMIIRMSQETFEALEDLQNQPKLEFEFGNKPGLYIGDTFYPVKASPENGHHHELYLRLPSVQKPMAPLKLYANVIGKFMVERQLGEKVKETVRDRTLEAEKQRTERKAIYLPTPPDLSYPGSKSKGKKDAAVRRLVVPASNPVPSSSKTLPPPVPSTHNNASSSEAPPTRARLIHCLALEPRTVQQVVRMCIGKDPAERTKNEFMSLLYAVAEHVPMPKNSDPKLPQKWQLKLGSWREVRPYEWRTLTSEERRQLALQARKAFKDLRIPETDPVWEYARYRAPDTFNGVPGSSGKPAAGPSAPVAEKNGVISKNTKKSKTADGTRKKVSDIAIPMKDESGKGKARDADEASPAGTPTSATRPPVRRLPGSGFKVKQSATPPVGDQRGYSPLPPPLPKKTAPVDARESRPPPPSGSAKHLPPQTSAQEARSTSVAVSSAGSRKKAGKDGQASSKQRNGEDRRDDRARERDYTIEEKRTKGRAPSPVSVPAPAPLPNFSKRKKPPQDVDDSEFSERELPLSSNASKRRKLDEPQPPSPAEKHRGRDLSLPKKPVVREPSPLVPRTKVKKESSPPSLAFSPTRSVSVRSSLPPRLPAAGQASPSSSGTKPPAPQPERNPSKSRRRSPIYTSSEDESANTPPSDEPPPKRYKAGVGVAHAARFKPRALPADMPGLKRYYRQCYKTYLELHGEQQQRRERIERLLRRRELDRDGDRDGDGTDEEEMDVDVDVDVSELLPEVLNDFMDDLNAVGEEVKKVARLIKLSGGKVESPGDE